MEFATRLVSTRRGTLIAAVLIALLAGAAILLYLNSYRESLKTQGALVTVLVATETIPKGTAGSVVAAKDLYTATTIRESQLLEGAMSDPATLRDRVATREIFDGAQLTAIDFEAAGDSLAAQLTDRQRVVSVPFDSAHGLINGIEPGNRVDVYAGFNVIPLGADGRADRRRSGAADAAADPSPMSPSWRSARRRPAPARRTSVSGSTTWTQPQLAFASDNGKLWLALRPSAGAKTSRTRHRHDRDHAARRSAGAGPEVARRPSMNARGFHVYAALEENLGLEAIREALPTGTPVRAVSLAEAGLPGSEIPPGADLVVVGCSESHDQALEVISAATAQRVDRPVVVLYHGTAERVPPAGLRGRRRRPDRAAAVRRAARVRAREGAGEATQRRCRCRRGSDDRGARAQGRYRQDGHVLQPGGRAGARGQVGGARRPRPAVRRRRPRARPAADTDDLRSRGLRAVRSTPTRSTGSSHSIRPVRERCSRRSGRTRRRPSGRPSCARCSRSCARDTTFSSSTRPRHLRLR